MRNLLSAALVFLTCCSALPAAEIAGRYAIIVRRGMPWKQVVGALQDRYDGQVFTFDKAPEELLQTVARYKPRYACFVCEPTENFPEFVLEANRFCRELDADPYVDAIWGILTGLDEQQALQMARSEPVIVRRAFTKTQADWLDWVAEGEYVTEWTRDRGEVGTKHPGETLRLQDGGPQSDADDLKHVHSLLSRDNFDLIIGSGHGGQHNWMLMYPSGSGFLTAGDGALTMTAPGVSLPLRASRPKLYWAVGNCLTGEVNSPRNSFRNSYALAWMKNGARQYIGAVQPTWYELNWNMADWFLKQDGRWTFAESLFLLRQWSQFLLAENVAQGQDRRGTEYTDGIFVLYGDPALDSRIEKNRDPALDESLQVVPLEQSGRVRVTYTVKVNFVGLGNKRTAEKYDGWRIFSHLLPESLSDVQIEKSDFAKVVIPGDSLIWDAGTGLKVGDQRSVTFTAARDR
jgi:hypothetical protein